MGPENAECIDDTPSYELGNRNEGEIYPEGVQELLDAGYQVDYNTEKNTYVFTTYLGGEKYEIEGGVSGIKNGLVDPGDLLRVLKRIIARKVNIFSDKIIENIGSKYQNDTVLGVLGMEYMDYILFENGVLPPGVKDSDSMTPKEYLQSGINFLIETGRKKGYSAETMEALQSTTPEMIISDFQNKELESRFIDVELNEGKSFEERREEFLSLHHEKNIIDICEYSQDQRQLVLSEIDINFEGKLGELLTFLDANNFQYNIQNDTYISLDEEVVLSFEKDDGEGTVGLITLQNSPSGKHIADADTFMGEYFKTGYKKYDFQK